ncbi:hypothetical protein FRACYDRAFT_244196 [Fragilariopsis cylindrus CCMP1102]|uniref:Uncharacterized protein n=1 Tax=Fragilariopsis cylindrus CCMP1102 TaxID=635003 RepID=A0A1E7F416_9STRA|nr:hypothetical protein FRACYDRAFT_244196 [Fragilariopsis cylindrus CCMP1102]|eukprot:OEU12922.1 hypothetical protein FRACYDRAFT_244196 [Fragilariopsis cylindrus CCMP1102]
MSLNEEDTTVTITDKQNTSSDKNDSDDPNDGTNEAMEVTIKDLLLYFFLGATTLLLKGLSLTPSFTKAIGVQNTEVPSAGLAFVLGALLGIVIVTTLYPKLRPKMRVGISATSIFAFLNHTDNKPDRCSFFGAYRVARILRRTLKELYYISGGTIFFNAKHSLLWCRCETSRSQRSLRNYHHH